LSSERALSLLLLASALACADLGRGDPLPDATADTGAPATEAGSEGGAAGRSFARDVHPLLVDGCARCHSQNGQASNTALLLTADAGADLPVVARFVNSENPAGSRLLVKGAGMGHGGGAIYAVGTPEYQTILEWITQGSAP
jgi:mono/diheme cytochrome c family protein